MELSEAAKYSKAIKNNFGAILEAEIMVILSASPLLKIPIIGSLIKSFLFNVLGKALESVRIAIFFKFIDMRIADQKLSYTKAVLNWELAKQKGDPIEIEKCKTIMLREFDDFVRFNRV